MSEDEKVPLSVPPAVFEGLQQCKRSGERDMQEIDLVLRWLRDDGWYAAADWVEGNREIYLKAIDHPGFRPEGEE
jgi:hypothetical protein